MASPTSRASLIEYCLRRLGQPVIEVNVDPDQIEDKVDDALQVYRDYHSDGTIRTYLKHLITSTDVTNGYITIDPTINYVARLFPISNNFGSTRNMFDIKYQMALSDITSMYSYMGDLAYYEQLQQYLTTLDFVTSGTPQITFSRRQNRLYIWGDFVDGDIKAGDYIVAEVYQIIDPQLATGIYNDKFIKDYTTALIKQQWGMNLMKFEGMVLPGGVTLNGRQFYDDATAELLTLVETMRLEQEAPIDFFIG